MGTLRTLLFPGQDPYVVPFEECLLLIQSIRGNSDISIRRFTSLANIQQSVESVVWKSRDDDHSQEVWAPELHQFGDHWYIYYAECDGNNANHRMYVLESEGMDPMGPYHEKGKIHDFRNDQWAIDLTVFTYQDNAYAVWSGWETTQGDFPQNLYIARMSNPWTIGTERVLLSSPTLPWEMSDAPINEGPQLLMRDGRIFIVYSADASWMPSYKLGLLEFTGTNILNSSSWIKHPHPVFEKGETNVYGPGHASFIQDQEGWKIIYHAKTSPHPGWNDRVIRTQSFTFDDLGVPCFGKPQEVLQH